MFDLFHQYILVLATSGILKVLYNFDLTYFCLTTENIVLWNGCQVPVKEFITTLCLSLQFWGLVQMFQSSPDNERMLLQAFISFSLINTNVSWMEMEQKNATPHIGTRCWMLHSLKTLMFLITINSGPLFLGHGTFFEGKLGHC